MSATANQLAPGNGPAASEAWSEQRRRWTREYHEQLAQRLARVAGFVQAHADKPHVLSKHLDSCLILLEQTATRPDLAHLRLQLVAAIHPWPLRWGRWESWQRVLGYAAKWTAELGFHAEEAGWLAAAAELNLTCGRFAQALSGGEEAMDKARNARAALAFATAATAVVGTLVILGRPQQAAQLLADAEADLVGMLAAAADDERAVAPALLEQERADLVRQQGEVAQARQIANGYVARLQAGGTVHPYRLATALRRRATIAWAGGDYPAAADDLERSADLFGKLGDPMAEVFSRGNLGLVYYSMGRLADAATQIRACIATAEKLDAQWRLVRDVGNLAGVYLAMGNLELATVFVERHLQLAQHTADKAEIDRARANRAGVLLYAGRGAEALPDIQAALVSFRERKVLEQVIATTVDLSLCHRSLGSLDEAARLAEEAYAAAQANSFPTLQIIACRCLAEVVPAERRIALLTAALGLARKHGRRLDEAGCYLSLAASAENATERERLWQAGSELLHEIGAGAWLSDRSPDAPPLVALLL